MACALDTGLDVDCLAGRLRRAAAASSVAPLRDCLAIAGVFSTGFGRANSRCAMSKGVAADRCETRDRRTVLLMSSATCSPHLGGPGLVPSQEVFELGEELLDRIEIGTVGWQEEQVGADLADGAPCCFAFVAVEIVENHDIAFDERRSEDLLHVEGEEFAVDGSINDPRCINAIDT